MLSLLNIRLGSVTPVLWFLTSLFLNASSYSQTRDAVVRVNAEKKLKASMHDPASYEFVGLALFTTITYADNVVFRKEEVKRNMESSQFDLRLKLEHPTLLDSEEDFEKIRQLKTEIEEGNILLAKIDSVAEGLGKRLSSPVAYNYILRCRGKNAFGAKVLTEYWVQVTSPKLEVINITSEMDELLLAFGDFPGYRKLVEEQEVITSAASQKAQTFTDSVKQALSAKPVQIAADPIKHSTAASASSNGSDAKVYTVVEQQPEFVGGYEPMMAFLQKNLQYPEKARRMQVEGTVYVSFIVGRDGSLSDVKVIRGLSKECNDEAIRVVQLMPRWNPGVNSGEPVLVRYVLPIKFRP